MTFDEAFAHKRAIEEEIDVLRSRIEPHGTGSLHDTIAVLTRRVEELRKDLEVYGFLVSG